MRNNEAKVQRARAVFEVLENRQLLSSVTLLAHGLETSTGLDPWESAMKDALVGRMGANTAVLDLQIGVSGSTPVVQSFTQVGGPAANGAGTGQADTIIMLDWSAASNASPYVSTATIAAMVAPYLLNAQPSLGITHPLAEEAIHLIGHSRGGSLVSALAGDLGIAGVWVDDVTMLDPVPVGLDPAANVFANTVFADNYWETAQITPHGSAVAGAHNIDLTATFNSTLSVIASIGAHEAVVTYYHGTVDTGASGIIDMIPLSNAWYNGSTSGPRDQVGFAWSSSVGVARPADGVGTAFGGTAARVGVGRSGVQWPDVGQVGGATATVTAGNALGLTYQTQGGSTTATVTWYLDPDTNPYNGNEMAIGAGQSVAAGSAVATLSFAGSTAGVTPGTYHLMGRITDGVHTRYTTPVGTVTIVAADGGHAATYVAHIFQDLLGRTPSQTDVNYWAQKLITGLKTPADVAASFVNSTEYRTDLIEGLYQSVLGRSADAGGLSSWLAFFANGGTYEQMTAGFYGSDEFFMSHGGTNAAVIDAYYEAFLQRHADDGGMAYWLNKLAAGKTRGDVALAIESGSPEGATGIVTRMYETFLKREPDGGGLSHWVGVLQAGGTQLTIEIVFISSEEYYTRG